MWSIWQWARALRSGGPWFLRSCPCGLWWGAVDDPVKKFPALSWLTCRICWRRMIMSVAYMTPFRPLCALCLMPVLVEGPPEVPLEDSSAGGHTGVPTVTDGLMSFLQCSAPVGAWVKIFPFLKIIIAGNLYATRCERAWRIRKFQDQTCAYGR